MSLPKPIPNEPLRNVGLPANQWSSSSETLSAFSQAGASDRRGFLVTAGGALAAGLAVGTSVFHVNAEDFAAGSLVFPSSYELPKMAYKYDALEPYIDAQTMEIHHSKHHQAYINNANKVLADHPNLAAMSVDQLIKSLDKAPEAVRTALRNNAGGHANHTLFWEVMAPGKGGTPKGKLLEAINAKFGSLENLQTTFNQAAMSRFGSGWAWLVTSPAGLEVTSTPNQDSPLMEGKTPLLGIDVWEHAYYLHYQNRRADYVNAWWNVVNWDAVAKRLQ